MASPQPPELMDDLIGEILLRLPPEDPECLVRASLVCKAWRRLLSDPSFPRRYSEFHGSAPLLGFFHDELDISWSFSLRFIPFKEVSPIHIPKTMEPDSCIFDCRHGRVLLYNYKTGFIIWDPKTNSQQHIGKSKTKDRIHFAAIAVVCAVASCDHLGCHGGPSLLVFVDIVILNQHQGPTASARVYSTETGAWNAVVSSVHLGPNPIVLGCRTCMIGSSVVAGDALYFIVEDGRRILKYDLAGSQDLSLMSPPPLPVGNMMLMKAEGGGLGACCLEGHSLHIWSCRTGSGGGNSEWERGRVIQPDIGDLSTKLDVVDFAGAGSIFMRAEDGVFAVELKSGRARMIAKGGTSTKSFPS